MSLISLISFFQCSPNSFLPSKLNTYHKLGVDANSRSLKGSRSSPAKPEGKNDIHLIFRGLQERTG